MKVFAATLIILALMLLLIFINRSFILSVAKDLGEHLDVIEAGENRTENILEAEKYWKRMRFRASLSVNHNIVEEIDRRFVGLKAFSGKDRAADFEYELLLFRDAIKKMGRLEKLPK